jgi:hypothetical protein
MKKLFIVAIAIFLASGSFAQTESKLHFGLKAAPSLAWLRTDAPEFKSDGSTFGFSYGLITEFNFATNYAFATGIDVNYRGGKLKSQETEGDTTFIIKVSNSLQYVEIPISLKLKTNQIGYLTYYLQAGVAPGYNIRANADVETTITTTSGVNVSEEASNQDVQENINAFNLSMIIGGGIEYTMTGSTVLLAGIQFNNGFLDVFDTDLKSNSNSLALTVGVLF